MNRITKLICLSVFFLGFQLSAFRCQLFAQDKIVAIVNGDCITLKDLDDFSNFMKMKMSAKYEESQVEKKMEVLKRDLLDKLIEDRLILQEAKKDKITADENIVKSRINDIKKRYPTETEFQNELQKQGLVQADLEQKIREQLLMYNVIEQKIRSKIIVRPDEVTSLYENNEKDFSTPEERDLEVVMLENKDLADTFDYNFKRGEKLEDLASRYPIKVDKIKVSRQDELKKEIGDVVFNLNVSEVSGPVNSGGKFYIFKLDEIIPSKQLSLSQAQEKIRNYIFDRKMQEQLAKWLDDLKKQSYIKIMQG